MFRYCFGQRKNTFTTTIEDKEQLTKDIGKMGVQKSDLTFEGMFSFSFPSLNPVGKHTNWSRGDGVHVCMLRVGR
tara:strand:+ start:248 stop:472 length:225 start_codon:yes stop_codon:yes gene_type:complete